MESKMNIYQKLLKIQEAVIGLGRNKQGYNYKYVSGSKVLEHIKPYMNKLGLLLKQEVIELENTRENYLQIDRYGKERTKSEILSKAKFKFTWIDAETKETDENIFYANGMVEWDKGIGSAITYAERYFLLKYFHIATDEDDVDNPNRKLTDEGNLNKVTQKPKITEWLTDKAFNEAIQSTEIKYLTEFGTNWSIAPKGMKEEYRAAIKARIRELNPKKSQI